MVDRGFGIELEASYADPVDKSAFDPDWWNQAESLEFKLNDEPVTKSGSSRMNKRARAGIMKPTGSTTADADLQQLTWYFRGLLDNYKYTEGETVNTHEFWGGETKALPSFRGIYVADMLKKYLYGMLVDTFKLSVSNDSMTAEAGWIYSTEKAGIIGIGGETFTEPDDLTNEQIFIMFYDVSLRLDNKPLDGVSTALDIETNNNHNVDSTVGLGSRAPQKRAQAGKRENSLSVTTTLTEDTVRSILNAEYGEVNALEPTACKLLQLPLEITIAHCEDSDLECKILFPKCTVRVEYNISGVDAIEATLTLDTLGTGTATLADGTTEVSTDMYIKLINNQDELEIPNA